MLLLPAALAQSGGGVVLNVPPVVDSFTASGSTDFAAATTFEFTIFDGNGDHQITQLRVDIQGASTGTFTHDVTAAERGHRSPSSPAPDGFTVWDPTPNDGRLSARFNHQFAAPGDHSIIAGAHGASASTSVRILAPIEASMVNAQGDPAPAWGKWLAVAGAQDVAAETFLQLQLPAGTDAIAVVDFSDQAFKFSKHRIPIDGNMDFRFARTAGGTSPAEVLNWTPTSSKSGSITIDSNGAEQILVAYNLQKIPWPLPDGDYTASFTVSSA